MLCKVTFWLDLVFGLFTWVLNLAFCGFEFALFDCGKFVDLGVFVNLLLGVLLVICCISG